MYKTIIKPNSYKDSIVLMLLTGEISELEGVNKVSIMMATEANKSIFDGSGMLTDEVKEASPNDIAIVIDVESDDILEEALVKIDEFLNQSSSGSTAGEQNAITWNQALEIQPEANLAVISTPGIYAAHEANVALDKGLNVFMFSDNVSLTDEKQLKDKALEKELLVMGPDCGTGIISGIPIAFTNQVASGSIGVVGASGTGIQEITSLVHQAGAGITSALGTGGRDLHEEIGGVTMLQSIKALKEDPSTKVIVVLSKPSAPVVQDKINDYLSTIDKPVVTLFLGEKPTAHTDGIYRAYTLAEAARAAVMFDQGKDPIKELEAFNVKDVVAKQEGKVIKAYYSGGTLASEASMLISEALQLEEKSSSNLFTDDGFVVVDLGDDEYTQGKPHPMIDPEVRVANMLDAANDDRTGVVLFDVVLGYGSHDDMASALAPSIVAVMEKQPHVSIIATVCGTDLDPQGYASQVKILEDLGVIVCKSNEEAVLLALSLIDKPLTLETLPKEDKVVKEFDDSVYNSQLLNESLKIINVGLASFQENITKANGDAVQYDWKPVAGGNLTLMNALSFLDNATSIKEEQ